MTALHAIQAAPQLSLPDVPVPVSNLARRAAMASEILAESARLNGEGYLIDVRLVGAMFYVVIKAKAVIVGPELPCYWAMARNGIVSDYFPPQLTLGCDDFIQHRDEARYAVAMDDPNAAADQLLEHINAHLVQIAYEPEAYQVRRSAL